MVPIHPKVFSLLDIQVMKFNIKGSSIMSSQQMNGIIQPFCYFSINVLIIYCRLTMERLHLQIYLYELPLFGLFSKIRISTIIMNQPFGSSFLFDVNTGILTVYIYNFLQIFMFNHNQTSTILIYWS